MSFRCEECNVHAKKPVRTTILKRHKEYSKRFGEDGKTVIDGGGVGWEIHQEKLLCSVCAPDG